MFDPQLAGYSAWLAWRVLGDDVPCGDCTATVPINVLPGYTDYFFEVGQKAAWTGARAITQLYLYPVGPAVPDALRGPLVRIRSLVARFD